MKIVKASAKAVKFACMNFHYAKRLPVNYVAYSVFENGIWCGCVVFGAGVCGIEKPYNLPVNSVWELVRVALSGSQSSTSKAVSLAVRVFKKSSPAVRLLVSYADTEQGHTGTIYQAMNWILVGSWKTSDGYTDPYTGKSVHSRNVADSGRKVQFGLVKKVLRPSDLIKRPGAIKHKYIYPLHKSLIPLCKSLSKPYPKKNASEVHAVERLVTNEEEGGSNPTQTL